MAALLVAMYALVARVEFPVGAGHVVPTQLVLVPMLVLLPPATVALLAVAGLMLGALWDWARWRSRPERLLFAIPDGWHAIGPAAVLLAAGSPALGFDDLPLPDARARGRRPSSTWPRRRCAKRSQPAWPRACRSR